jgi:hypothetical protein
MSHTALIKFAPIFTIERFDDPAWNRPGRLMYEARALRFLPGEESVPLVVDHEESSVVGTVHAPMFKMDWIDGPWICARATVNTPPSWLERGTRASFDFRAPDRRKINIHGTCAEVIAWAVVREVSVLSAAKKPVEPLAEVLSYSPSEEPSSRAAVPDRSVARETDEYRPPFWDELERVVGYRVTDDNFERALAEAQRAQRGPMDVLYDEVMARKRARYASERAKEGVVVRYGVGRVLGVR